MPTTTTALLEPALWRKITRHLLLPIALLTLVNAIDRVDISYAAAAMQAELSLSPSQFGLGVSAFFLAYLLFQYPHSQLLRRIGISRWLLLSIAIWGVSAVLLSQVTSASGFYFARFLLGVAEAGFAPGMTWFIACWVPREAHARAMAIVLAAVPFAMVLGGPLCGWLLGLANPLHLASWRWMFLVSAVPNFLLALLAWGYFVDTPAEANWLTANEREALVARLSRVAVPDPLPAGTGLFDAHVWRCAVTWLLVMTGAYALVYWLPQLVRHGGLFHSELLIGAASALPQAGLVMGLLANAWHSDKVNERFWHVSLASGAAGLALFAAALSGSPALSLALLVANGMAVGAAQGVFWTLPAGSGNGDSRASVGVIAFINMAGTLGGLVGPWLLGLILEKSGSFVPGICVFAALLVAGGLLIAPWRGGRPAGTLPAGNIR